MIEDNNILFKDSSSADQVPNLLADDAIDSTIKSDAFPHNDYLYNDQSATENVEEKQYNVDEGSVPPQDNYPESDPENINDQERKPGVIGDNRKVEAGGQQDSTVETNDVKGKKDNIIGKANHERKDDEPDRWPLIEIRRETWQKVKSVFVPSPDYEELREREFKPYENHVFIVYGPEHSGKFTCAIQLGLDLFNLKLGKYEGDPQFSRYRSTVRDARSIIEFAQYSKLPENTVFIVRDAFENGVALTDLSVEYLAVINAALESKGSYLILTTTYQPDHFNLPHVQSISGVAENMRAVFENHLVRYSSYKEAVIIDEHLIELSRKEYVRLEKYFRMPFQIDMFFRKLGELPFDASTDDIVRKAKDIGRIDQDPARPWFESLHPNAKFYAMLVVLFDGTDRLTLDLLYLETVQRLRKIGISNLIDPREIGLRDLLEALRAQDPEDRYVRFSNPSFKREIQRQIINNHHLLWSLIDAILELIETFKAPEFWEFRRVWGAAIGQLGIYQKEKLRYLLSVLAKHSHGGVVAVAGYALDEICRIGPEHHSFVVELLEQWSKSGNPDFMWAVGASVWRIYDGLKYISQLNGQENQTVVKVKDVFTSLVENFDNFNGQARKKALALALRVDLEDLEEHPVEFIKAEAAIRMAEQLENWAANNLNSILHAIRRIALNHPGDIVKIIKEWLETDVESNLYLVAKLASYQLFNENAEPETKPSIERHRPLLELGKPLLSTKDEVIVNTMLNTLLNWLQHTEWVDVITRALIFIVNRATSDEASLLRESLSNIWLESDSLDARNIGQSLIARSYVMNGVPMDLPGQHFGVLALDASPKARLNRISSRVGRKLYARFTSQIDIRLIHMGNKNILAKIGQTVSTSDLQADHDYPRILVPPLEEFNPQNVYFILAITWGTILDIDDLDTRWFDRFILATTEIDANWTKELPETISTTRLDGKGSLSSLLAIENLVRERILQALAARTHDEWILLLQDYFDQLDNLESVITQLSTWIENLDDTATENSRDLTRTIICTIVWLAKKNLSACVNVLRTWLENNNELYQLMGAACGKALFYAHAHAVPIPSVDSWSILLELAHPLSQRNWDGAKAVLHLARYWTIDNTWAERFLTHPNGGAGELLKVVDEVIPKYQDELSKTLANWRKPLPLEGDEIHTSVIKIAERLELRVALGTHKTLPKLDDGQMYGLIVIDGSGHRRERSEFANIACGAIKKLSDRYSKSLHLLTYRMGQDFPISGSGEKPSSEVLIPIHLNRQPRLLSPILELYNPEQVGFVLLFTNAQSLDQGDWETALWSSKIIVYSSINKPVWAVPFRNIPYQSTIKESEEIIVRHLSRIIGD